MSKRNRARKQQQANAARTTGASVFNLSRRWIIGLILAATFFAFSNSLFNGFAYDDTTQILQNSFIRDFKNLPTALVTEAWFWRAQQDEDPTVEEDKPTTAYYRPMVMIYLMVGWHLFGDSTFGWHLASILMHLLATYLIFLMLEKVTKDMRLTIVATLLFAVHPLRSESVAWISGMTDLFLALFLVPAFYLYMKFRETGRKKYLMWGLLLFLVGAFAKEPAVALPIFIFAYELFIVNEGAALKERLKPAIIFSAIFMAVSVGYFAMRYVALGFILGDPSYVQYTTDQVILTIPLVIWKYIGLLFAGFVALPADLLNLIGVPVEQVNFSLFHATPMVNDVTSLRFILPALGLVALAIALWPLRKNLISRFAVFWFFIHLLPVLNLNAFSADFLVQERYVYISSIGFSLLLAQGLSYLLKKRQATAIRNRRLAEVALVALVVILFSGKAVAQNGIWKDDTTLWTSGAQSAYDQTMPYFILGHRYIDLRQFDKAIEMFEKYIEIDPSNHIVLNNLAASHLYLYEVELAVNPAQADQSRIQRAIALCNDALKITRNAALYDTLGKAYTFTREFMRAHAYFDLGLKLSPTNPILRMHKGATFLIESTPQTVMLNVDLALAQLEMARQVAPGLSDVYKYMAYAFMTKGMTQDAINYFNEYLRLQPYAIDRSIVSKHIQDLSAKLQTAPPKG